MGEDNLEKKAVEYGNRLTLLASDIIAARRRVQQQIDAYERKPKKPPQGRS
jgi:hypothetical protein